MSAKGKDETKGNNNNPSILLLYKDSCGLQHVISHTIDLKGKEMSRFNNNETSAIKPMKKSKVDVGSSMIRTLSSHEILVMGEYNIIYHRNYPTNKSCILPLSPPTIISSCVSISADIVLLGDKHGYLFMITLVRGKEDGLVTSLKIECLGITSASSNLIPIPNTNLVYVGSTYSNSQLIHINNNNTIEIIEEYSSLGPIVDFDIIQRSAYSPSQIVTCSGASKDATVRLIMNSIGMEVIASVELSGIQGM